jgi:hypothetical protein
MATGTTASLAASKNIIETSQPTVARWDRDKH